MGTAGTDEGCQARSFMSSPAPFPSGWPEPYLGAGVEAVYSVSAALGEGQAEQGFRQACGLGFVS